MTVVNDSIGRMLFNEEAVAYDLVQYWSTVMTPAAATRQQRQASLADIS